MAELPGVGEEEYNQDNVIAPVNYSPEVEAAIQEVFLFLITCTMVLV